MYLRYLVKCPEYSEYAIKNHYNNDIINNGNNSRRQNTTGRQVEDTHTEKEHLTAQGGRKGRVQKAGEAGNLGQKRDSFIQQASSTYCVSGIPSSIGNTKENKKNSVSALKFCSQPQSGEEQQLTPHGVV